MYHENVPIPPSPPIPTVSTVICGTGESVNRQRFSSCSSAGRMTARFILIVLVLIALLTSTSRAFPLLSGPSISSSSHRCIQKGRYNCGPSIVSGTGRNIEKPRLSSLSRSRLSITTSDNDVSTENMPELGNDGVYHITDETQHKALLRTYPDKLIVMKVYAPWCRACKGLEPKFNGIVKDPKYSDLPIVWADLTIQHNKDYIKKIGVMALPTVQFYARSQRMDTFPCGPSKVPILKRKLAQFVNENVDSRTKQVKSAEEVGEGTGDAETTATDSETKVEQSQQPTSKPPPSTSDAAADSSTMDKENLLQRHKSKLRTIPYFMGMLESEFESVLSKANILTFESGNIIMREGNAGRTFYYIADGEVEICQKSSFEDPLTTPPSYLGTVINRFESGEYFGERALITGEPRAASIRASSRTMCLAFDRDDFPPNCVLSGKTSEAFQSNTPNEEMATMNERYGVSLYDYSSLNDQQYLQAVQANQIRGSVNKPFEIDGVDNDREVSEETDSQITDSQILEEPAAGAGASSSAPLVTSIGADPETIVPLLLRFKLIRLITRSFDYIVTNRLRFGDEGGQKRRMLLVNLLSIGQQAEIREAYNLIDADGDGEITLGELRRLLESVGDVRSDKELVDFIETSHRSMVQDDDGKQVITYRDFFGIMAEVEFYHLFLDTFKALDEHDSGFVRAKDLDRVLCGIRDLVTDDRRSIIDVEDTEMMVDYEQFSKMLLGTALT